jgi:hypothetical protein
MNSAYNLNTPVDLSPARDPRLPRLYQVQSHPLVDPEAFNRIFVYRKCETIEASKGIKGLALGDFKESGECNWFNIFGSLCILHRFIVAPSRRHSVLP